MRSRAVSCRFVFPTQWGRSPHGGALRGTPTRLMHFLVAMPRYFFNIREGNRLALDEEGMILPGLEAATREAEQSGREILADMLRDGTPLDGHA